LASSNFSSKKHTNTFNKHRDTTSIYFLLISDTKLKKSEYNSNYPTNPILFFFFFLGVIRSKEDIKGIIRSKEDIKGVIRSKEDIKGVIRSKEDIKGVIRSKEDIKGVIRSKRTNNDMQNTTQKTKERSKRTPLKTGGELICSGRVSSSCSTSKTWVHGGICPVEYF
jgi:hypothetical protein